MNYMVVGQSAGVVGCMCALILPITGFSAEKILWPDKGHFLAYPEEPITDPIEFSVSAGITHDDNLFRLSDSQDPAIVLGETGKSDTITRLGLGLKAIKPVSRQRYIFDASVDRYAFNRFSFLDHWDYKLGAGWQWEAGNLWNGDLGYSRRRYLGDLAEAQGRIKDLITRDYAHGSANYKFHSSGRVRGAFEVYNYEHSESSRAALENRAVSATIGADYLPTSNNHVGLQFKITDGRYPNREVVATSIVDNKYREYETSGVIGWQFASKTRFDGRLGYTKRKHDELSARDYSGATGRATLLHTPSAKTLFDLSAYRETRIVEDLFASYVLAKGTSFGPAWAPTEKTVLQARVNYEKRTYLGDPGFALNLNERREDTLRSARITAGYKPLRRAELSLAYERGKRTSNAANLDHDYHLTSLNGSWAF